MRLSNNLSRRRRSARGFTMLEVAFSLFIFMLMTLMFAAVFPAAIQSAKQSNDYAQAMAVCRHKIDQVESVGYSGAVYNSTSGGPSLLGAGIVDSETGTATTYFTADFTTADNLTAYFPAGTTGTVTIAADPNDTLTTSGVGNIKDVTVTVTWPKAGTLGGTSYYSLTTNLIDMPDK